MHIFHIERYNAYGPRYISLLMNPLIMLELKGASNLTSCYYLHYRDVQVGDVVTVGECRPLSKTVRFNVIKVSKTGSAKKSFQKF